jgi:hypothetical protein
MRDRLLLAFSVVIIAGLLTSLGVSAAATVGPYSACPSVEEEIVDLIMLTTALRNTKAVGPMTKIRLKNNMNRVLNRLEQWHDNKSKFTLDQLEEQYHLLLMKIATLIHDDDLMLHQQLCNAWARIWLDLKDPDRFRLIRS